MRLAQKDKRKKNQNSQLIIRNSKIFRIFAGVIGYCLFND
ncbi:hypothetical protein HMPREF9075_02513 [Capnocytophaga sp. oral taxon 332 str. F0381]|nr:hypothetical protein HMPREF9075_02513 [Capnocytophaga sp. oral taxon 332 str. F0381]